MVSTRDQSPKLGCSIRCETVLYLKILTLMLNSHMLSKINDDFMSYPNFEPYLSDPS